MTRPPRDPEGPLAGKRGSVIHRYNPGHGKGGEYMGMEEDPEGHWCAHEDVVALEKQVADFRASSQAHHERALRETDRCTALERLLIAERAAHEATKRDAATAVEMLGGRLSAASARVAELVERHGELSERAVLAETSLDQARELLEDDDAIAEDQSWVIRKNEWLRAHPATATPAAARDERLREKLRQMPELMAHTPIPATPAATGAERVNAFILREVKDGAIDNPGGVFAMLVERAEKEQGT